MIDIVNWRHRCCRIVCNLNDATSLMTSPIQLDVDSNVSRKCVRSRLLGARRVALHAVASIDTLIADLERLG